jgi:uncharacterized membrane-anchored protein YhcB (DUF1043 family)
MSPPSVVAGALISAGPIIIQPEGAYGGLLWTASVVAAVVTIGVGASKAWTLARTVSRRLDQLDALDAKLDQIHDRLDKAQL